MPMLFTKDKHLLVHYKQQKQQELDSMLHQVMFDLSQ
jgi:hypothetical protein